MNRKRLCKVEVKRIFCVKLPTKSKGKVCSLSLIFSLCYARKFDFGGIL